MNLATKLKRRRRESLAILGASTLALAFLFGCADRGATNLYSQALFGQTLAGPNFQVWRSEEDVLLEGTTSSAGLDGYIIWLRNNGQGATVGPIFVSITAAASPCAVPVSYGAAVATAIFGVSGRIIYPGDVLQGQACDNHGNLQNTQYSFEEQYNVGVSYCAGVNNSYTLNASDSSGNNWTTSFSANVE